MIKESNNPVYVDFWMRCNEKNGYKLIIEMDKVETAPELIEEKVNAEELIEETLPPKEEGENT